MLSHLFSPFQPMFGFRPYWIPKQSSQACEGDLGLEEIEKDSTPSEGQAVVASVIFGLDLAFGRRAFRQQHSYLS